MTRLETPVSEVVNVGTAALWLGVSERTITRLCREGRLAAYQPAGFAGRWLVYTSSLEAIRPCPKDL